MYVFEQCVHNQLGAYRDQRRTLDPPQLEVPDGYDLSNVGVRKQMQGLQRAICGFNLGSITLKPHLVFKTQSINSIYTILLVDL